MYSEAKVAGLLSDVGAGDAPFGEGGEVTFKSTCSFIRRMYLQATSESIQTSEFLVQQFS